MAYKDIYYADMALWCPLEYPSFPFMAGDFIALLAEPQMGLIMSVSDPFIIVSLGSFEELLLLGTESDGLRTGLTSSISF